MECLHSRWQVKPMQHLRIILWYPDPHLFVYISCLVAITWICLQLWWVLCMWGVTLILWSICHKAFLLACWGSYLNLDPVEASKWQAGVLTSDGPRRQEATCISGLRVGCIPSVTSTLSKSRAHVDAAQDLSSPVQFSCSVVSDFLWPHGLQHTRLSCSSLSPGACSNSCPLSWGCHPTISSSIVPLSSCLQSFPASGSFPMSQLFASGGQNIAASA